MGFFDKIFSNNSSEQSEKPSLPWKALVSESQVDSIVEASKSNTQLIFKHSTRCGISRMVLSQFEKAYNPDLNIDMYFLDLLQHRELSRAVADTLNVYHESPQLIIIKNGVVVKHASHGEINTVDLSGY
ncbi:bacillithiol system redox-active protein YtxJ [Formosa sediminum]|uniref:Bacillithiol system redox-active protein YtxJ n=1 Tax=Formosa sediminum TaxID=2594004 RepID=A0A516GVM3_9FLAO|nr:bacillithiol system redox-active protein YtxJ [Formosa sediminum]QDO95578.1 bacillithiol system redox-active protein YtxJ [Formosa sediminum]